MHKNPNGKSRLKNIVTLLSASFLGTSGLQAAQVLTYKDLVERLTNMESVAVLPQPGEQGGLASSYDRSSRYDAKADKYLDWGANRDGSGVVRTGTDGSAVLAEIKGPGCIWRIWSAAPDKGHLQIYLDDARMPVLDLPFVSYFDPKSGPFPWPNLVYIHAGDEARGDRYVPGSNIYIPIPFQKSCRIVGLKGWGQYYHFSYTRFTEGTTVPTFTPNTLTENKAALDEADKITGDVTLLFNVKHPGQVTEQKEITVPEAGESSVFEFDGPAAITGFKFKLDLPKDDEAQRVLLRQLTLSIVWDDEGKPAVWSPLGDFFGCIGGSGPFQTIAAGLLKDGTFYSNWYMPFGKKARISIRNDSSKPVAIHCEATHAALSQPIESLGYFHAKWHRDSFMPVRDDRKPDWTVLVTKGRGRFVGMHLHVWTPVEGWWGEGDEKFFVDGEKFPSTFGTGSEDYFGYAWSSGLRFVRPFHCQALAQYNMGHESDCRWQISENVPFQTSFEGTIEKYWPNEGSNEYQFHDLYAAVAYWYLAPGGEDPYSPIAVTDRIGYWKAPVPKYCEPGVIEGEDMQVATPPLHQHYYTPLGMLWAGGTGKWSGDKEGAWGAGILNRETLELLLPVKMAGNYRIVARFTKGPDYGVFQPGLDGEKLGNPVDLYNEKLVPGDPVELGTRRFDTSRHVLSFTIVGFSRQKHWGTFGLDYVKLVPVN